MKRHNIKLISLILLIIMISCGKEPDLVTIYSSSPNNEIIIEVASPRYADSWDMRTKHNILWTATPEPDLVDLHLYKKDEFIQVIDEKIENVGYYNWEIGLLPCKSHHYMIKIFNSYTHELLVDSEHFFVLK